MCCSMQSDNNKQISNSHLQQFRSVDAHVSLGRVLEQGTFEKLHENSPVLCNSSWEENIAQFRLSQIYSIELILYAVKL